MTNEQLFDDLKQFITATISQQTAHLATKDEIAQLASKDDLADVKADISKVEQRLTQRIDTLDQKIDGVEQRLGHKLDEVQAAIGDTLIQVLDALDVTAQNKEIDRRVHKLEKMAQIVLIRGERSAG